MKFNITFSPQRNDARQPSYEKEGDSLFIDGEEFDFEPMPDGATLSAAEIASGFIVGNVTRTGDTLFLSLALFHGAFSPEEQDLPAVRAITFPEPFEIEEDGTIEIPVYTRPETEVAK